MVATGLLLWAVARVPKAGVERGFGLRLVQTLNVATIAGLPMAIAGFFLANRLLPVALAGTRRLGGPGLLRRLAPRRGGGAVAAARAGLARGARGGGRAVRRRGGGRSRPAAAFPASAGGALPADFLVFDTAMLALAALFAFAARKAARIERVPRRVPATAA